MPEYLFSPSFSSQFDVFQFIATTGARPHYGFPFWLGSEPLPVSTISSVVTHRWTTVGASSQRWTAGAASVRRFERVFAQPTNTFGQSVNFIFHVQSQFPFIIKADSQIYITSTITNP